MVDKGKNFSCNNLGQRLKSDLYQTPFSITQQLLDVEVFDSTKPILEPAAGHGAIVRVLDGAGLTTVAYDAETDFLTEQRTFDYIITNPPYSLAMEFILKAKAVCTNKFAMLLPLAYLHGKKRLDRIYSDTKFPLARVYVFVRYPMLTGEYPRSDGRYNTGMMVYAWFVWDRAHGGQPHIHWIDNNSFVLRKS